MESTPIRQLLKKRKRDHQAVKEPTPPCVVETLIPHATAGPFPLRNHQSLSDWQMTEPATISRSDVYHVVHPTIYTADVDSSWTHGLVQEEPTIANPEPVGCGPRPLGLDVLKTLGHDYPKISTYSPRGAVSRVSSIAPSTISQLSSTGSGSGSVLSPVCTTSSADWIAAGWDAYSRGPSPCDQSATPAVVSEGKNIDIIPHTVQKHCRLQSFGAQWPSRIQSQQQQTHTCNWTGCSQPSFSFKDGLAWHVKLEHLVVCPVPGCLEDTLQSVKILQSHIRCAHPASWKQRHGGEESPETPRGMEDRTTTTPSPHLPSKTPELDVSAQQRNRLDKGKCHTRSVDAVKTRCRGQLFDLVTKKARLKGGSASPNTLQRLVDNVSFPIIWEHGVLPFLIEFVPSWCGPKHTISIIKGRTQGTRRVCIMTEKPVSRVRRVTIAGHVCDLLPETHKMTVSFLFSTGAVERLVWARGLASDMPDETCLPRNPFYFREPCMGDSIGIEGTRAYDDSTATLGPCVIVGGGAYWLANFHPFINAFHHTQAVAVQHPSPMDRERCMVEEHDTLPLEVDFSLGKLTATSGLDLETTRVSHDPYWDECGKEPPLIVTDWILISSLSRKANVLRRFPSETMPLMKQEVIKDTAPITPGAIVYSTGRTSGPQRGQICEVPAYVSAASNGTGKATREWFIEELLSEDEPEDDEWIRGGMGCPGDSGAAIVDAESSALLGQLWGRNAYYGPGPRVAYFTPITDLFDDIQERCAQQSRPQLPADCDDCDRYPVYPGCRRCYDLRNYLDSRRSSRESLRSMIGGVMDSERVARADVMSITEGPSELATPKDQSYWLRHAGTEDIGNSFPGTSYGLSPAGPANLFGSFSFAQVSSTPKVLDVKSPYATTLNIEEPYEVSADVGVGTKRQAVDLPLAGSANPASKRAKIPQ